MAYIYGLHAVDSLLRKNPGAVLQLWLQRGRDDKRMAQLSELARNQGVSIALETRAQLDLRVTGRHQGVVAEVADLEVQAKGNIWPEARLLAAVEEVAQGGEAGPALILILDGITDPHNLGACLRSADAAGVDAVVVTKDKAVGLNATVRKVACGAAETVPFVQVTNLSRTLQALQERGVWLYGAAGEAQASIYDIDLTGSVALVMGAEGSGLRRLTRSHCDELVRLPMAGSVSSLNVSVATGICLFEAVRQRGLQAAGGGN